MTTTSPDTLAAEIAALEQRIAADKERLAAMRKQLPPLVVDQDNPTQFGRAMRQLGIEMIPAYSPEARGRSERAFGTLQARGVLRDVGRVLQMSYGHVDKLCKLVPQNPAAPVTTTAIPPPARREVYLG